MQPVPAEVTGLSIHVICDVARGENTRNAGRRRIARDAGLHDDVTVLHVELALEELGVRRVSNCNEEPGDLEIP
jgi:hypothetical protein